MEPEVSILCSQEPSTGPYPEPYQSHTYIHMYKAKVKLYEVGEVKITFAGSKARNIW
jgi:hypothetical protein